MTQQGPPPGGWIQRPGTQPPAAYQPPPGYVVIQQKRRSSPLAAGCLLLVVLIIAVLVLNGSSKPSSPSGGAPSGLACSPQPCISDASGMNVYISKVDRSWPPGDLKLDPGHHLLHLTVAFDWEGADGKTASPNPLYFRVIDSTGVKTGEVVLIGGNIPGCEQWSGPELARAGTKFGPEPICFDVAGNPSAAVTLVYQETAFDEQHSISI